MTDLLEDRAETSLSQQQRLDLYRQMVLLRRCELATQKLFKEGKLPGFIHLYVGEEAVAVGACAHLRRDDWITSTHRGHGHALAKGVEPKAVLAELAGKATGCCGGRGGSMHMFDMANGLFGTTGVVGAGLPLAVGLGISASVRKSGQVAVCFFGDGAVNHGAFHESVNFAGVMRAPVVFLCENNLYGTSTPFTSTTLNTDVSSKAVAYGIPGVSVDGNDVMAVWNTVGQAIARARRGEGPTLVEARTYRVVGHHEGDVLVGTYRTQAEIDHWKKLCPIACYRALLLQDGLADDPVLDLIDAEVDEQVREAVEFALASEPPAANSANDHVFADPINPPMPTQSNQAEMITQGWLDAVRDGIAEEMRRDSNIIYFGEGIGERGGSWGHTKGLWHEFGGHRVIDTPISELAFTGAAIGASASGCRAFTDLLVADFLFDAASQIVDQAAKLRYMSNGQISVPAIIRSGVGTIRNAGPHHSGMYHPMWAHIPGLIIAVPSNPADAKGLMKTALRASDPVIFHEHKSLFSTKGPVPIGDEHLVPFGLAKVVRLGKDITIVSCGLLLQHSLKAAETLERDEGVSCEVVDLRTIVPLDVETIVTSVSKTGRLLVVDESYSMCGIGAEIAACVTEQAFDELDAPIGRLHTDPVSHPFAPSLENTIIVTVEKIKQAAKAVLTGTPLIPRRLTAGHSSDLAESTPAATVVVSPTRDYQQATACQAVPGIPLIMPHQDLTITEATIVRWLKQVGDPVNKDEAIVEVETDKAIAGIEAPASGVLLQVLVKEGDVVALGQQLGTIQPNGVAVG